MSVCKHQENKGGIQAADILLEEKEGKHTMSTKLFVINKHH